MKLFRMAWVVGLLWGASGTGTANAQLVSNLYSFAGSPDGQSPVAGLVQGSDGNFYGTTLNGGANSFGTVFRISATGSYSNLYSFGSSPDGQNPYAGLVQGSDGNFYGTTQNGGANSFGTVFRISATGSYSNLYSFGSSPAGNTPLAGLVQGSDGNFYGTTTFGGATGNGTVFRISATGSYSNLYSFAGSPDGQLPQAGLVQGSDGNFYGTTVGGGTSVNGTVFRISATGSYSNLYSFAGSPDGQNPIAGLVQGSDGNFYGTTSGGGANSFGTVFRISATGSYSNLYSFAGLPDGRQPRAGLVQGSDGNFYGTTAGGGTSGNGTVFRISATGSYSNLYSFVGFPTDGQSPVAGVVQGSDGNFYGTTPYGGANNGGTVFKLTGPFDSARFRITSIVRQTNDVAISWVAASGAVNVVQVTAGAGGGSYSTNFTDLSAPIFVTGSNPVTTNYLEVGGATNSAARYYRIKQLTALVYYSFNRTNDIADIGAALSSFSNFNPAAAAVTFPGGSLLNGQSGFGAGVAISQSGWTNSVPAAFFQFGFNGSGYSNIVVSFWEQKSASGPVSVDFQVSTNGGALYTTFTNLTAVASPGSAHTVDLTGVTGLNNNPNDVFRLSSTNAPNVGGTYRIDNLTITGVAIAP